LEDDPSNMRGFSALLSSIGYSVLEATTGKCVFRSMPISVPI